MKRLIVAVLLLTSALFAQSVKDQEVFGPVATGVAITAPDRNGSGLMVFEHILAGSPSTVSTVTQGCMRGGTCSTLNTNTSTSNARISVAGGYDYYTITPTFTGGSSPTLTVYKSGFNNPSFGNDGTSALIPYIDPCKRGIKTYTPISLTANTKILTGVAAKKDYFCAFNLVAGAATNVAIVEGTGSVCATGTAGVFGGATAATGWNFAANGGIAQGNGDAAIGATSTAADDVCIFVSAANQVSGVLVTVKYN